MIMKQLPELNELKVAANKFDQFGNNVIALDIFHLILLNVH